MRVRTPLTWSTEWAICGKRRVPPIDGACTTVITFVRAVTVEVLEEVLHRLLEANLCVMPALEPTIYAPSLLVGRGATGQPIGDLKVYLLASPLCRAVPRTTSGRRVSQDDSSLAEGQQTMLAGQAKHEDSPFYFTGASVNQRLALGWRRRDVASFWLRAAAIPFVLPRRRRRVPLWPLGRMILVGHFAPLFV